MGSRGRPARGLRGAQHPRTRKGLENGKGYHRRLEGVWRPFRGQKIGDWEVIGVETRFSQGVVPDLVLLNTKERRIVIHDYTSAPRRQRHEKRKRYVQYFERAYPQCVIEYGEGYWRRIMRVWEATDKHGEKYWVQ